MTIRRSLPIFFAFFAATLLALLLASAYAPARAGAQESTVTFPVAELGNCESKAACHTYCDDLSHVDACVRFAESHGLMSADDARHAREFARLGGKGPGGCTSKEACEAYCEEGAHMRECIAFARQSGMMDERELAEAEKVAAYLDSGGALPGGCTGERACRAYCEDAAHADECVAFATKAGFMTEKEAEIFRKTGGKGPGGCAGRACETYCEDEAHREECIRFALEHDLMSPEERQRMEEGMAQAKQALEKAPPAVLSCIEAALGADLIKKVQNGEGFISPRLGEVLPDCFRQVMGNGSDRGPFGPGSDASGCMRAVFGDDYQEKIRSGEIDPGAREQEIRDCMQAQMGAGYLDDEGRWERPQSGEPQEAHEGAPIKPWGAAGGSDLREEFEREFRGQYDGRADDLRAQMEARMRAEIEAQMQSGNFDPRMLPPDFRPEGFMPPPESFNRPPEGFMPPGELYPHSEGMMPAETGTSEGYAPPATDLSAPTSKGNRYTATVMSIILSLFGL